MATYSIEWRPSAVRELKRLDHRAVLKVLAAVEGLRSNPLPTGVKKLQGSLRTFRLRVGDYRVIYDIIGQQLVIQIIRVRHRKDAYRV